MFSFVVSNFFFVFGRVFLSLGGFCTLAMSFVFAVTRTIVAVERIYFGVGRIILAVKSFIVGVASFRFAVWRFIV